MPREFPDYFLKVSLFHKGKHSPTQLSEITDAHTIPLGNFFFFFDCLVAQAVPPLLENHVVRVNLHPCVSEPAAPQETNVTGAAGHITLANTAQ